MEHLIVDEIIPKTYCDICCSNSSISISLNIFQYFKGVQIDTDRNATFSNSLIHAQNLIQIFVQIQESLDDDHKHLLG